MMPEMELEGVESVVRSSRLADLVGGYTRRILGPILAQHPRESVSSALGVWLLLAACVTGAVGDEQVALEEALGCSASEAAGLLEAFTSSPPEALKAAIAVWVAVADVTAKLAEWVRGLPPSVESGFMPTKQEADAWADRNTLGLIKSLPLELDAATRIVLASALATKVSWAAPFELVEADEHLGGKSPWRGMVEQLLWDREPGARAMIVDTKSAGLVAAHQAMATEELTVLSVSASPSADREDVLAAAHEIAAGPRTGAALARSLFDLPLGDGHSWTIEARETRSYQPGERMERITGVSLPAWKIESKTNLLASERFGSAPALETMGQLIAPGPDDKPAAIQSAVASFTRYGLEAAAVTVFAIPTSAHGAPDQRGIERTAVLRFDHPYAAVAIAGRPVLQQPQAPAPSPPSPWNGLPLFSAWIQTPTAADERPPRESA